MARQRATLTVLRSERLTGHLIRVYFTSADFRPGEFSDSYVKFIFDRDGQEVLRTYTVRRVDPATGEIAVDFVHHGEEGIGGPWAAGVTPGATVDVYGPGGAYSPRADADWHLLAGDEAALPAIAAALAPFPAGGAGHACVVGASPADELALVAPEGIELTWLHRGDRPAGELLAETVRSAPWREGQVQVFIHGEARAVMHDLRRYIRREREVPAQWASSISGYWRRGRTEEGFRRWKAELAEAESVLAAG
ncbi:siderophore-interacting protein [Nocardia farcinica]|uniref:siderophore-interacting protein n=1 Tax=Nocardia farcinica TaxID=37329 RepID=UPI002456DD0C|nr:siderophore-interacting protein [Nocardia farcinica]